MQLGKSRNQVALFFWRSWLVLAMLMPVIGHAASAFVPAKPDQAFMLTVDVSGPRTVNVEWRIAKGYFLYAKRTQITADATVPIDVRMPASKRIKGLDGQPENAYMGQLSVPVVFAENATLPNTIPLTIRYQGCAQDGFCYPPMKKIVSVDLTTKAVTFSDEAKAVSTGFSFSALLRDHNKIKMMFSTQHVAVTLMMFLVLGVLLAFTPCVLPMLPILTGIIVGEKQLLSTQKAFFLSCTYVLGVATAYAIAGVLATLLGSSIQVWMQQPVFIILLTALLVLLAFSLFEFFDLPVSRRWQNKATRWSAKHQGGTYVGVFFMGILSTLIVSPCITAPMLGVLLYIGQTGDMVLGASALFTLGIGMGIPLVIVAISAGQLLPKSGPWMRMIVKMFGLVMLAMAIWVLSRLLSDPVTVFIWGLYFLGIALFMCVSLPHLVRRKAVGLVAGSASGVLGALLMLNAMGVVTQLSTWTGLSTEESLSSQQFIVVRNLDELQTEITKANNKQLPVLVDFYADWCESCVSMDKKVFDVASMQPLLDHFVLIRADLTDNTAADELLMKKYDVIAPPTILFFTQSGQEVNSKRIVGEVDAKEFTERLNAFRAADCSVKVQC